MNHEIDKDKLLYDLNERAKELKCIYSIEEILLNFDERIDRIFQSILKIIPPGWQFPEICFGKIEFEGIEYVNDDYRDSFFFQSHDIIIENIKRGTIYVYYDDSPANCSKLFFLNEEHKLLSTIADRISNYMFNRRVRETFKEWTQANMMFDSLLEKEGKIIQVLMNSDLSVIAKYLESPSLDIHSPEQLEAILDPKSQKHWKWRAQIAGIMAQKMGTAEKAMQRFGVAGMYLFGSVKNADSGPESDIDLLIHFRGNEQQKRELVSWIEGWSYCLSEMNYSKTGHRTDGLIDYHIITDEDIENKTSYAIKIGAITDSAQKLEFART